MWNHPCARFSFVPAFRNGDNFDGFSNSGLQLPRVINSFFKKFVPAITDRMTISLHKDLECYQVNDVCQGIESGIELRTTCSIFTWVAAYSGLQWRLSIQWVLRALCLDPDLIFGWKIVFSLLNYNSISNFDFWIWISSWSAKWVFLVLLWVDFDCMCIRETGLVKWHLGKRT